MRLFASIYDRTLALAGHRRAPAYLSGISAAESIFFPIPPDVMLIPMTLAQPSRGMYFALLCTVASVLGGLVGYLMGAYAFEMIEPLLHRAGYWDKFVAVQELFVAWGFWVVLLAGFSPIPYKVFTIASGVMGVGVLPFLLGSMIGRGGRFFLVAGLIMIGGAPMEATLRRNVEWLGWLAVIGILGALAWLRWV